MPLKTKTGVDWLILAKTRLILPTPPPISSETIGIRSWFWLRFAGGCSDVEGRRGLEDKSSWGVGSIGSGDAGGTTGLGPKSAALFDFRITIGICSRFSNATRNLSSFKWTLLSSTSTKCVWSGFRSKLCRLDSLSSILYVDSSFDDDIKYE